MIVSLTFVGQGKAIVLTVTIVWAPVPATCVVIGHSLTIRQYMGRALWPGELVVAATKDAISLGHLPLL